MGKTDSDEHSVVEQNFCESPKLRKPIPRVLSVTRNSCQATIVSGDHSAMTACQ